MSEVRGAEVAAVHSPWSFKCEFQFRIFRSVAHVRGSANPPHSERVMSDKSELCPIRVFVHLAYGFGGRQWYERWRNDQVVGLNDALPYGYYQAAEKGCLIEHSDDKEEGPLERLLRLATRA